MYLTGLTVGLLGRPDSGDDEVIVTAVSPGDYVQALAAEVLGILAALAASDFSAPGHQDAVANFLQQVVTAIEAEDPATALAKLDASIERTDGFPLRGALDASGSGKDWVPRSPRSTRCWLAARNALVP